MISQDKMELKQNEPYLSRSRMDYVSHASGFLLMYHQYVEFILVLKQCKWHNVPETFDASGHGL